MLEVLLPSDAISVRHSFSGLEWCMMDVCEKMLEKTKLLWSKTNRWHRGFLLFFLAELRLLPGGQVGFTCNDPALSHPYTGDTINWKLLLVTTILLPLVFMLIVERRCHSDKTNAKQQALLWYREHLFGILINLVIIQIMKQVVGSPRPHFFDTCSPKEALTCEGSEYITSYTCTKASWISQSDRSFPSGHASLALQTGLLLVYYLHRRTACPGSRGVRACQLLLLAAALYCGASRVTDRRHHWWDVLAGAGICLPVLYYTVQNKCGNFECSDVNEKSERSHLNAE